MTRTIEIRRHSLRRPPAPHLVQEGVTLARRVGETTGPFDKVVTSTAPRAFETAIAMGFAVDEQAELISTYGDPIDEILPYPQTFAEYHQARQNPVVAEYLEKLSLFYKEIALSLPKGGAALVVNHGGIVEMSAVACVPDADYRVFGPQVQCCEGVRLRWGQGTFVGAELIRLKPENLQEARRRVDN